MKKNARWIIPILLMILITPFTPTMDLAISNYFYSFGGGEVDHFPRFQWAEFLYEYGEIPALITVIGACVIYLLSFLLKRFKTWRNPAVFLILTLAIGSGFIVNILLKDHWGRPRPKQVEEFGGMQDFRPYWSPNYFNMPEPSKSFPCGHCSMGFYFFAVALLGERYKNRAITLLGYALAFGLGITLSFARVSQGGHFLSDTLWSALIMWLVALIFNWLIFIDDNKT